MSIRWIQVVGFSILSICAVSVAGASEYSRFIVFGNSHVDQGNLRHMYESRGGESPDWRFNFTTGKNFGQLLADRLSLENEVVENYPVGAPWFPVESDPKGDNYATGGTTVPFTDQVGRYLDDNDQQVDQNALVLIALGTNYIGGAYSKQLSQFCWFGSCQPLGKNYLDARLVEYEQSLRRLIDKGARHIVVLNVDDASKQPFFALHDQEMLSEFTRYYNRGLANIVASVNVQYGSVVTLFDLFEFFDGAKGVRSHYREYGFQDAQNPCNIGGFYVPLNDTEVNHFIEDIRVLEGDTAANALQRDTAQKNYFKTRPKCTAALTEKWFYNDSIHWSEKTHRLIANQLYAQISKVSFPPILDDVSYKIQGSTLTVSGFVVDRDDQQVTLKIKIGERMESLQTLGAWTLRINNLEPGEHLVSVSVADLSGQTSQQQFQLKVVEAHAPTVNEVTVQTGENSVQIKGTASDIDGDLSNIELTLEGMEPKTVVSGGRFEIVLTGLAVNEYSGQVSAVDSSGLRSEGYPVSFEIVGGESIICYEATIREHASDERAYGTDTTYFWWTTTRYYAKGSDELLGSSGELRVSLEETSPGYWKRTTVC